MQLKRDQHSTLRAGYSSHLQQKGGRWRFLDTRIPCKCSMAGIPAAVNGSDPATNEASLGESGCGILHKAVCQGAELDAGVQVSRQRHECALANTLDIPENLYGICRLPQ